MKVNEIINEDWNKINHHDKTNGLSQKAVNAYRREHPGSKLKTAVTTKPSKLKPGSKDAKRRKSFCARMSGNKGPMKKPNGKPTPKALALRRWHCESLDELLVTARERIYEAEGEESGLKHLTPHLARDILDQMEKEGVHAIVKSIEWGDGGAKELIAMIKRDLEQVANNVSEAWSQKYKSSINCSHPKGFSQKAHCAGKKKHNESHEVMEMTCPDCGMCETHGNMSLNEIAKGQKDSNGFTKCWPGHHAAGTKKGKNGGQVRNCVPNESTLNEFDFNRDRREESPLDNYPCYDCGSTIFHHHTKHCELAEPNAIKDLPSKHERTQHWNGHVPHGLHPIPELDENFADGKHPEDKGDSARHGIPKHASISTLRKIAHQGGRKGQLAHWQANMRSGHNK